ncbi:conserved protein of unknown function [Burkholderia multivorans]
MKELNYLALAIGIALSIVTAYCVISRIEFLASSEVSTGKVVSLKFGAHHPEITFDAGAGKNYETTVSAWKFVDVGQAVQIRYSSDDPRSSAILNTFVDLWNYILLLAFLAILFLIGGLRGKPFKENTTK